MGFGFSGLFVVFPILFGLIFFIVIGVFIYVFINAAKSHRKNITSPTLTVDAVVASKRMYVSTNSFTSYYTTFQVPSGDRMELELTGEDYGYLAEGDSGRLTFQGTRFLRFERI